jgi:hypothetical protein
MRRLILIAGYLLACSGCTFFPQISRQPIIHNPFPQLSKVAIAPFFNHSAEPTVDGRQFALAYFNELQVIPGFEVVALGRVEQCMQENGITLASAEEVRKLAQLLEVDALVVGAVTDFSPYYPPRCGMEVQWYAANPGYHPIPPGYGLPWGTPEEEQIPPSLIFQARMALAREQMKTQDPTYRPASDQQLMPLPADVPQLPPSEGTVQVPSSKIRLVDHECPAGDAAAPVAGNAIAPPIAATGTGLPGDWPDPRGFAPPPPAPTRPPLQPSDSPVLRHTRIYHGNDSDVTEALATYYYFRDDARFGGWGSYLQRSDDFIRFCCHMHIAEMLTARGGAGETRVVWRWPISR